MLAHVFTDNEGETTRPRDIASMAQPSCASSSPPRTRTSSRPSLHCGRSQRQSGCKPSNPQGALVRNRLPLVPLAVVSDGLGSRLRDIGDADDADDADDSDDSDSDTPAPFADTEAHTHLDTEQGEEDAGEPWALDLRADTPDAEGLRALAALGEGREGYARVITSPLLAFRSRTTMRNPLAQVPRKEKRTVYASSCMPYHAAVKGGKLMASCLNTSK
ncbi:hypothetical protein DFH07DRAFT_308931 [Mycena maculata]|uniref:Uncharacterized protein n=1 Tax=Mycena maculata TaxID=230809 RepID=A0AAD7HH84_9AGAR|nr:hypothetical protein DFH07DRAFT_308931 [Mycena maculata]